jgi:glycosyltransferase involved in cell wall biosynthesis
VNQNKLYVKEIPQVLVLLSTYNGEKYLDELLESLLQQESVHLKILVRDDGSTDRTVEILEKYLTRIILLESDYKIFGPDLSYKILIKESVTIDHDYVAFCDQDDIWMPDKIIRSLEKLQESGKSHYSSARLRFIGNEDKALLFPKKVRLQTFRGAIFENISAGCTTVLERGYLLRLLRLGLLDIDGSYDHTIYLYSLALDESFFDSESRILYRIHSNNAVGLPKLRQRRLSKITRQIRLKVLLLE